MRHLSRWALLGFAAVLAVACGDIASPLRSDFYEWRLIVPKPAGPGEDSLSFHWDRSSLPVRIWVENGSGLPEHMARAIGVWEAAFLYREFVGQLVSDSTTADVIVRAGAPTGLRVATSHRLAAMAPECSGATDLTLSPDHTQLELPVRIALDPGFNPAAPGLAECLALTSIHELGHAIGIFRHSTDVDDIMFFNPSVALPSERDRETAEVLYHAPANLEAVPP